MGGVYYTFTLSPSQQPCMKRDAVVAGGQLLEIQRCKVLVHPNLVFPNGLFILVSTTWRYTNVCFTVSELLWAHMWGLFDATVNIHKVNSLCNARRGQSRSSYSYAYLSDNTPHLSFILLFRSTTLQVWPHVWLTTYVTGMCLSQHFIGSLRTQIRASRTPRTQCPTTLCQECMGAV